jgi:hypothetical protein
MVNRIIEKICDSFFIRHYYKILLIGLLLIGICCRSPEKTVKASGYILTLKKYGATPAEDTIVTEDISAMINKWDYVSLEHLEVYPDNSRSWEKLFETKPKKKNERSNNRNSL